MKTAIEIKQMAFSWAKQHNPIIEIEHWQLAIGQSVFLYGPSGSGKSTLLNLLSGILVPQRGEINLLGQTFSLLSNRQRDNFRAANIGVIFQQFNLIPYLSVADNIRIAVKFAQKKKPDLIVHEDDMAELLEHLSLSTDLLNQTASQLSVGQQQRVAIARALIHKPGLLIADEPTSALDSDSRNGFLKLFLEAAEKYQSSVIFVSHDRTLSDYFEQQININQFNQVSSQFTINKEFNDAI